MWPFSSRRDCHHRFILSLASGDSHCFPVISPIISSSTILLVSRLGEGSTVTTWGHRAKKKKPCLPGAGGKLAGVTVCLLLPRWLLTDGGPGKGFLGPCCRPWGPPRPVLLEVDRGRATLPAGALGGRVVLCLTH